ncbi:ATP-grasp domain-containing protein (plasmid) [Halorussus salilacus]|uniref:ATP-grasp domain-containing protein n=1 Tax=Halorussus salilacus TaxID=2953750 RepID=UPI0020A17770|nr:ATP-grasp domain-containing protein [Halorussus salilacus]USZ69950.1 ATP-grasp domain-containing protein [Halorussus salilacus]
MTVVLIGEAEYKEFELLSDAIEDRGGEPVVWDTTDWPSDVPVTYDVGSDTVTVEREFRVEEVTAVFPWVHHIFHPALSRYADEFEEHGTESVFMIADQWRGVFRSLLGLFENHGATVFYPPGAQQYDDWKPLQLEQLAMAGVSVPDTVFTTDPDRVREFVAEHGEVVYKPVADSTRPNRLSESDLGDAPLDRLSNAPVQFQEYAPGDDVRAYFLDGEVVGASRYEIDDWTYKSVGRVDDAEPVDLREEVRRDVERAARVSPIRFGAVDLRVTDDEHALLEVNPGPRFAFHDLHGATDIAGVLADALVE